MPLDFLKKTAELVGSGFKKALESFGILALFAFVIVVAYFGIDVATYAMYEGIEVLEAILALVP